MYKLLFNKVKKNSALFVMLSSSFCTFLSVYLIKNMATDGIFSLFVLLQIYIGYSVTLGALGSDNVILRYVKIDGFVLTISKTLMWSYIRSYLLSFILFMVIGRFMFENFDVDNYYLLLIFVFGAALHSLSMWFRLVGNYTKSQIVLNGWKLVFLSIIFLSFYNGISIEKNFIVVGVLISMFLFIVYALNAFRNIKINIVSKITQNEGRYFKLQLTFVISLLFFAILGSYDRVALKDHLTVNEFAEYSYLVTLLLFPIGIIANYIGFKELIEIKKGKSINLTRKSTQAALCAVIIFLIYTCFLYMSNDYLKIKFDFFIWVAVLIIVLCKVPYSFSSAILGAKGEAKDLNIINALSLVAILASCYFTWLYGNVYFAIYSVSIIWVARSLVFYKKALVYV